MYYKYVTNFMTFVGLVVFFIGCSDNAATTSPTPATTDATVEILTDSRDGRSYKIVSIGTQVWMAQNLNYQDGRGTCYNESVSNCDKYGRLYSWFSAIEVCPDGWHLPSLDEWNVLFVAVGGKNIAGKILKSQSGWGPAGGGLDSYGFSALPAGYRSGVGKEDYFGIEAFASFWSSTPYGFDMAYGVCLGSGHDAADMGEEYPCFYRRGGDSRTSDYSVRCIKD